MSYESYAQIEARLKREARERGYKGAKYDDYVNGTMNWIRQHRQAKWRRIFAGRR
jgi:hypothetical protein